MYFTVPSVYWPRVCFLMALDVHEPWLRRHHDHDVVYGFSENICRMFRTPSKLRFSRASPILSEECRDEEQHRVAQLNGYLSSELIASGQGIFIKQTLVNTTGTSANPSTWLRSSSSSILAHLNVKFIFVERQNTRRCKYETSLHALLHASDLLGYILLVSPNLFDWQQIK